MLLHLFSAFKCDAHIHLRKEQCPALRHCLTLISCGWFNKAAYRFKRSIRMYPYWYLKKKVYGCLYVCIGVCIYVSEQISSVIYTQAHIFRQTHRHTQYLKCCERIVHVSVTSDSDIAPPPPPCIASLPLPLHFDWSLNNSFHCVVCVVGKNN